MLRDGFQALTVLALLLPSHFQRSVFNKYQSVPEKQSVWCWKRWDVVKVDLHASLHSWRS